MGPIDYLSGLPQQDFLRDIQGGFQLGTGIRQAQQQQAAQQLAQQRAVQYQADAAAFMQNPNPQGAAALALKYPDQYEPITKAWAGLSADQQKNELKDTYTIASTLHADRSDLALQQIDQRIAAMKNSGQSTAELDALRGIIEKDPKAAYAQVLHIAAGLPGGKEILANLQSTNKDDREGKESESKLAGQATDLATKNLGIVAQKAGALAKPGVKPEQAQTMFRTLAAQGLIPKADLQGYIDGIPTDPKALPDYLKQVQASGMKPDDQMKFTTPTADAALSANTQVQTTGMNNRTQLAVQDRIDARAKAESEGSDDAASFSPEAIDNAAARYNIDGTLPPMGMGKAAAAGRTKILNRAAELKAGISGEQQRRDQLGNKGEIASQNKAVREFASGKLGSSVRSFNVGLSHLDTLGQLADAMGNKDTQAINRLGNYFATQTGADAPVKFEAAKKVVTDEIVKAIVGAGGTGHDREEAAKTVSAASSPAQLRGVINTYKELMVGQLGGLDQQYRTSTGRDDFHKYLSPQALTLYGRHGGAPAPAAPAAAAPAIPAGWSVREH